MAQALPIKTPTVAPKLKDFNFYETWELAYKCWLEQTLPLCTTEQQSVMMDRRAEMYEVIALIPYQYEDENEPRGHMLVMQRNFLDGKIAINMAGTIFHISES